MCFRSKPSLQVTLRMRRAKFDLIERIWPLPYRALHILVAQCPPGVLQEHSASHRNWLNVLAKSLEHRVCLWGLSLFQPVSTIFFVSPVISFQLPRFLFSHVRVGHGAIDFQDMIEVSLPQTCVLPCAQQEILTCLAWLQPMRTRDEKIRWDKTSWTSLHWATVVPGACKANHQSQTAAISAGQFHPNKRLTMLWWRDNAGFFVATGSHLTTPSSWFGFKVKKCQIWDEDDVSYCIFGPNKTKQNKFLPRRTGPQTQCSIDFNCSFLHCTEASLWRDRARTQGLKDDCVIIWRWHVIIAPLYGS